MLFSKGLEKLLFCPENKEGVAHIPDQTQVVPPSAFSHSAKVSSLSVGKGNVVYSSSGGVVYSFDMKTLVCAPLGIGNAITIAPEAELIGEFALTGCSLVGIVSSGNIVAIDKTAFSDVSKENATVVLQPGADLEKRKSVWEKAGFSNFETVPEQEEQKTPSVEVPGFAFELQSDYTLSVSWQGAASPKADVVIPATAEVDGVTYRVSKIAEAGFSALREVQSVSIPSSVTEVGARAFSDCPALVSVSLAEGIVLIGDSAFAGTGVERVLLPTSVQEVGSSTFAGCANLTQIVALSDIESVADDAISGCSGVSILTPYRSDGLYLWNPDIVSLGNHIKPYGIAVSQDTINLDIREEGALFEDGEVVLPAECELSFSYPASCVSVSPEGVACAKQVGDAVVAVEIRFADKVLARKAFDVTVLSVSEQRDLTYMKTVPLLDPVAPFAVGETVVIDVAENLVFTITPDGLGYSVKAKDVNTLSGKLDIPAIYNGLPVTKIDDFGFKGATGITSLVLPDSIKNLGYAGFMECSAIQGPLVLPSGLTRLEDAAFYGCGKLTGSITIPATVTYIGGNAFFQCSGFTGSLVIPDSVTAIGIGAFNGCSGLTGTLTLSQALDAIPDYAFYGCGFTGALSIPSSVTTIGDFAFWCCAGFEGSLVLPEKVTSLGQYSFQGCKGLSGSLVIPDSVTTMGAGAFFECINMTGTLSISKSLTVIPDNAFADSGFTGPLTIPYGVTSVGYNAFLHCYGFTGSLQIPETVTKLDIGSFNACTGLTGSLTIPSTITVIP
ncbi:MAG: leucine-rich repeat domain-containing protein, partial [Raoultibacter sp.]